MKPLQSLFLALFCIAGLTGTSQALAQGKLVFDDTEPKPAGPTLPGVGQGSPLAPNPFVAHLPDARNTPAPDWLKPGARMTWWMGSSTIIGGGNDTTVVPDPNGNLVDSAGNRYRQSTAGGAGGTNGGAGAGYIQIDIIYANGQGVMYDTRTYFGDGTTMSSQISEVLGDAVNPGSCEWWIHPRLLAQVKSQVDGSFRVLRGPWDMGNQKYDAIIFQTLSGPNKTNMVYDLKSGISLGSGSVSFSKSNHTGYDPNTGKTSSGSSQNKSISNSVFLGLRYLNLPWGNAPLTGAAAQFQPCVYRGSVGFQSDLNVPGSPIEDTCKAGFSGQDCYQVSIARNASGARFNLIRGTAATQIGGYSMNVGALRTLRQGQQIDQDAITRYRTYVHYVGANHSGQPIVVIAEQGPGGFLHWIYSAQTGQLIAHSSTLTQMGMDMPYVTYMERTSN